MPAVLQRCAEVSLVVLACLGVTLVRAQSTKPDDNRFTPVVLVPGGELDEPMAFQVIPDGRVYIIERKGALKVYDPQTKRVKAITTLQVNTKYTNAAGVPREAEEGLLGLTLDPNFAKTRWVYMLYAHPSALKHVLARWVLQDDDTLVEDSEIALLEYSTQRETCCHTGGGMAWDAQGNLYLAVGNNTGNVMQYAADRRASRPRQLGRPADVGQHQRSARQDPPHPSAARRDVHDSGRQPLSAGHGRHAPGNLRDGAAQPLARVDRLEDRMGVLGRCRARRQPGHGKRAARIRRAQSGARSGVFRLALFHRREPRLSVLRLREEPAAREEGSGAADQHVREQLWSARVAAGATCVHLVPLRRVRQVSARRHGGAVGCRRPDLPSRGPTVGIASVPRLLRRPVVHRRSVARVDHVDRDGRARRLPIDGALPARLQADRADRPEVWARRRSVRPRIRQPVVSEERRCEAGEDRIQRGESGAEGQGIREPHRRAGAVSNDAVRIGHRGLRRGRAHVCLVGRTRERRRGARVQAARRHGALRSRRASTSRRSPSPTRTAPTTARS